MPDADAPDSRAAALIGHLDDRIEDLRCELHEAICVLWRRGDDEARVWIRLTYPRFHAPSESRGGGRRFISSFLWFSSKMM